MEKIFHSQSELFIAFFWELFNTLFIKYSSIDIESLHTAIQLAERIMISISNGETKVRKICIFECNEKLQIWVSCFQNKGVLSVLSHLLWTIWRKIAYIIMSAMDVHDIISLGKVWIFSLNENMKKIPKNLPQEKAWTYSLEEWTLKLAVGKKNDNCFARLLFCIFFDVLHILSRC